MIKKKSDLREAIESLKAIAKGTNARSANFCFKTPDDWKVTLTVEAPEQ